ncbi:TlpA family protein disulfide reductase [Chryseobacterium gregarium]|uniref:TlpA family protein disulfide reductase n=1 Tax=Chryseobacterium gregarium TaxID=456299 RepID=UPI00041226D2|nr:TlpA disulfide reductase family protein [Chryseobacterium gregarium]
MRIKTIAVLLIISFSSLNAQQRVFGTHPSLENKIGTRFPIEDYTNQKGEKFTPDALKGKNSLINFWSASCEPCIEELPYLNRLKERLGNKANFIAITYDSHEKTAQFLSKREFNFLHITDSGKQLNSYFPLIRNLMTFILDNRNHRNC